MRLASTSAYAEGADLLSRLRAGIARSSWISPPLPDATRGSARAALRRAFADATRMPGNLLAYERLDELSGAGRRIVAEVELLPAAPYLLTHRAGPQDYPVEHAIDATVVGLLVGRRLDLPSELMLQLGTGLFLRDVGQLALPPSIVTKPGPLAEDEWELMRRHPLRGLELLRGDGIGRLARSVVLSHHERWDGNGYPSGLAGTQIPRLARIAALADAFTAITSERHHAGAASAPQALGALRDEAGAAFDPELVDVLCELVEHHPPGPTAVVRAV